MIISALLQMPCTLLIFAKHNTVIRGCANSYIFVSICCIYTFHAHGIICTNIATLAKYLYTFNNFQTWVPYKHTYEYIYMLSKIKKTHLVTYNFFIILLLHRTYILHSCVAMYKMTHVLTIEVCIGMCARRAR